MLRGVYPENLRRTQHDTNSTLGDCGVAIADRSNPKTDVVKNFAVNAIETEGDQWTKEGILRDADHHFDAVR